MDDARTGDLLFIDHGAQYFAGAVISCLDDLRGVLAEQPTNRAGVRLTGMIGLRPYLNPDGLIGGIATRLVGARCRAVRAILFDKTITTNWSLAWHQDRTICVRRRVDMEGFGPWTVKSGLQHVAPPFALLERMVTLRIHLDRVSAGNAPLRIAPGSHRMGRIAEDEIAGVVDNCGIRDCLADAGDIWAYATPILHASEAATDPTHRRVLQVDFSADVLPGKLEWLGV